MLVEVVGVVWSWLMVVAGLSLDGVRTILLIPSSTYSCTVHEHLLTGTNGMRELHAQEWHFVVALIDIPFRLDGIGKRRFPPTYSMASAVTLVSHGDTKSST